MSYCRYANEIWQLLTNIWGVNISLEDIVIGDSVNKYDNSIVTLIASLIYKKWLLESLNNIKRDNGNVSVKGLLVDLKYR